MCNCNRTSKIADFAMGGQNDILRGFKPRRSDPPCCCPPPPKNYCMTTTDCPCDSGCATPPCSCYPARQQCFAACCETGCEGPSQRLINIDAMEELCYFTQSEKNPCACDLYNVCEQCGTMTKFCSDDCPGDEATPVKYSRRQRFVFRDKNNRQPKCLPPWAFPPESLDSCCNSKCAKSQARGPYGGGGGGGGGPSSSCRTGGCAGEHLPNKTGVYYFNRREQKLVLQTKQFEGNESMEKSKAFRAQADILDGEDRSCDAPPVIIQPLTCPVPPGPCPIPTFCCGGGGCGGGGGGGCGGGCGGCCGPCCGGGGCGGCGCGGCGCGPCCGGGCGCGGGCCGNGCCGGGCCNPCGCCGPCCCCFPPPGSGSGAPNNNVSVSVPPPAPPPAPPQTTVIPMCIPINPPPPPPPPCMPCPLLRKKKKKKRPKFNETLVEYCSCDTPRYSYGGSSYYSPGYGHSHGQGGHMHGGDAGGNHLYRCDIEGCSNGVGNVTIDGVPCNKLPCNQCPCPCPYPCPQNCCG